jgi:hypothetical protein
MLASTALIVMIHPTMILIAILIKMTLQLVKGLFLKKENSKKI